VSEREVLTAKGWPELLWSRIGWNHVYTQLCTVFLAGKSPKIRSHTVCIQYFWQGNHHPYGHIRCVYSIFGREITIHTVIYGVYTVFLAGKSPYIRSHTVCIYGSANPTNVL